ncbi:hypothetical protein Moror_17586 [Moniliophthora roreri MCA 2997]|uniref:Uncharacterized protein n=1 Tax=Moniliophthora roreri (strain MCA 2997) TaxID=1381753 RepID=V2XXI8_MONRO|nr:hypothetical protein Moror_17586 [Moniliophthora roreri MCA 2997]KAI3612539.1 hypothetical protein WG66_009956 [Moniliophthora roreri]
MLRRPVQLLVRQRRYYSADTEKPRSAHAQWYTDIVPAMIPIFLLGSAVYLGLQLAQTRLSHEKYIHEAKQRVDHLEAQIQALQQDRQPPPTDSKPGPVRSWWWW